jgi:hypothetical protein
MSSLLTGQAAVRQEPGEQSAKPQVSAAPQPPPSQEAASLPQLLAFVSVAGVFIILCLWPIRPHDFWWHVRVGQWIVEHGRVPGVDLFSFTRLAEPYAFAMWLMEVVFYLLLRIGGLPLLIFFHSAVVTGAYGLLLAVNRRAAGGNWRWAALTTVAAAAVGLDSWNVRPQSMSILLFALTLYLVERHAARHTAGRSERRGDRWLWSLPPTFALWANAHGGFVFGLALLVCYLLAALLVWLRDKARFPRQLLAITALSATATMVTPLGLDMIGYVLGISGNAAIRHLTLEWQPPTVHTRAGQLFFSLVVALVALLLASRYRLRPCEAFRLLLFGGLALTAGRNTLWFGMVAAPTLAAALACWASQRGPALPRRAGRRGINLAIALIVGLLALLSLPWFRPCLPLPEERRAYVHPETPVEAVAFLRGLLPARRTFHSEAYGSYMIWASPEIPIFIDTRIELYPLSQWQDYIALSYARYDWQTILDRYGVDTLFLQRETQQPLIDAAIASPHWERIYEDEGSVILERQGGA